MYKGITLYLHEGHNHGNVSPEERVALLDYMIKHNAHHAEELHDLAHDASDEVSELIHGAVRDIEESNAKLAKALELLK